jgi:hypothetical protein
MPMRYDTTRKTLFQVPPPPLLQLLVGGQAHTVLTVKYLCCLLAGLAAGAPARLGVGPVAYAAQEVHS